MNRFIALVVAGLVLTGTAVPARASVITFDYMAGPFVGDPLGRVTGRVTANDGLSGTPDGKITVGEIMSWTFTATGFVNHTLLNFMISSGLLSNVTLGTNGYLDATTGFPNSAASFSNPGSSSLFPKAVVTFFSGGNTFQVSNLDSSGNPVSDQSIKYTVVVAPEPASLAVFALMAVVGAGYARRRLKVAG